MNNTGFIGTIRSNKNEVPDAFLPTNEREIYSSEFAFNEFLTLVSYCPKIKVYLNLIFLKICILKQN